MSKRCISLLLFFVVLLGGQPLEARRRWVPPVVAGGGGPTADLFNLNFEETGTPPGVTVLTGAPNFDNTTAPLSGAQDNLCDASNVYDWNKTFTASNEVWCTFEYSASTTAIGTFLYLEAGAQYVGFRWGTSGGFQLTQTGGGNVGSETADAVPTSTHLYCRLHVLKGTGANAVYDLEWNTSNSFTGSGTKFTSYSSGTVTNQFVDVEHYHNTTNSTHIDNLKGSSTGWPP